MLDAEDSVELRALQARAYGRVGALSDADAARLRELEDARTGEIQTAPAGTPESAGATSPHAGVAQATAEVAPASAAPRAGEADEAAQTAEGPRRESAVSALRRRWRLVLVLVVAFLVAGLGLGWLLFADRGPAAMQLTGTQQEWHNAILASGDYDPGSLRAMREEEGVVIWFATKNDGADVCLVMGDADAIAPACSTREQAQIQGVGATFVKAVDDDRSYDIDVQLYVTDEGEPAVIARSYISAPQSTNMFASPEEADQAVAVADSTGLDLRSIQVVGYDGDVPIWTGIDETTQRFCLVYDGSMPEPPMACDESLLLADAERTLALDVTGAQDGAVTRYEYRFGYGQQQYLTVTKGLGAGDAAGE